ncbi:MAG: SirB1 family protein, partial [Blastocatellia bacterium]
AHEDPDIHLATAALVLAKEHYPRLIVRDYIDKLQSMADRVGSAKSREPIDMILAVNAVLFHEFGFRGNAREYYDPRNSFLNQVIDRRIGIPITLSVLYMDVARRVGLDLFGVGMPGHFLVKHADETGEIFIDPFNQGRIMDTAACGALLSEMSSGRLEMKVEFLNALSKKQTLIRILANLFNIYGQGADHIRALWAADRILMIEPNEPRFVRDRGFLLASLDKLQESISALERYLRMAPLADDAPQVQKHLADLKKRTANLN